MTRYDDPDDPDSDIVGTTGTLPTFIEALRDESTRYDDVSGVDEFIEQFAGEDSVSASALAKKWAEAEVYASDDAGRFMKNEMFRAAVQRAGFDGVVDRTVNEKFGSTRKMGRKMTGMNPDTTHFIVFEPQQAKSAIGNIAFDPLNPKITMRALTYREKLRLLGGAGSGNFGHAGRPGEVGGSAGDGDGEKTTDALRTAEERAAIAADYEKLQANRADEAAAKKYTNLDFGERMAAQHALQGQLKALLPKGEGDRQPVVIIASTTPTLLRTADKVLEVLDEMKGKGLEMPTGIMIEHVSQKELAKTQGIRAAVHGAKITEGGKTSTQKQLVVQIPDTLPDDAVLDHAVASVFSGTMEAKGDPDYQEYDRYTARTMRDIIVHEMGHVQAGHRGGPVPGSNKLVPGTGRLAPEGAAVRRAANRVSGYATTNADEFLAEAFTRLYRGERLAEDSQAVRRAERAACVLSGDEAMSLPWPALTTEEWKARLVEEAEKQQPKALTYREKLAVLALGGPGSGHHGHGGRPGEVGGSAPGEGGPTSEKGETRAATTPTVEFRTTLTPEDEAWVKANSAYKPDELAAIATKADGGTVILTKLLPADIARAQEVLPGEDVLKMAGAMLEGIPGDLKVHVLEAKHPNYPDAKTLFLSVQGDDSSLQENSNHDLKMGRAFVRHPDGTLTVHHQELIVPRDAQGKGLAKTIMAEQVATYERLGVSKVELEANLERGAYAWAKFGFTADDPPKLAAALTHKLSGPFGHLAAGPTPLSETQQQAVVDLIATHKDAKTLPWHIAGIVTRRGPGGRQGTARTRVVVRDTGPDRR